jgi:hypothetical protein
LVALGLVGGYDLELILHRGSIIGGRIARKNVKRKT